MSRLLIRFLRPYFGAVSLVMTLLLVQAVANLYLPSLNADIINDGVAQGDIGKIWSLGSVMLVVTLLLGICTVVAVYWAAKTAMAVGRDVRAAVFTAVESFSAREVNQFGAPSLITRNTNDVQQIQMFLVMALTIMVLAPITCVGGIIMALRENVKLSSLLVVVLPLMAVVVLSLVRVAVPLFRSMQKKIDRINQVLREQITGVRVVRAFVRGEHEEARFERANADLTATALRIGRMFALAMPAMMAILNLSSVAVIWFGGHLVDSGGMPIGNLTAFLQYLMQILISVLMAMMMAVMIPRASACADRIQAVLQTQTSVVDPAEPVRPTGGPGLVEFRDVEFRYPGADEAVLRDITFTVRPGETTAVVGGTGSGKTTLVNLIPRFYDVTGGTVLVDGVDVRQIALADLWARIGLVPQQSFLFSGSVASNLRFGRGEASESDLRRALEVAQADEFVAAMPEELEADIAQGGTNVSGGQRQRLAIARALAKQPEIYIFDDSFSALDYTTDARLRAALRTETRDAAVLIVAQRVSTVMQADQIVVLDEGTIAGVGTHAELMADCEPYREIVFSQLTAAEAA